MDITDTLAVKLRAFDRLFLGIHADQSLIAALRQRYVDEFPWNKNTTQIEQMCQEILASEPWEWSWHSLWQSKFETLGDFPRMWTTLSRIRPRAIRETGTYDHRIFLLAHTLAIMGHRERDFSGNRADYDGCYIGHPLSDEPPAVAEVIRKLAKNYASKTGPADPPPFFPGDRTDFGIFNSKWKGAAEYEKHGVPCLRRPRF